MGTLPGNIGTPQRNQIRNLKLTPSSTFLGLTVSFQVVSIFQVANIALYRSFTKPDLSNALGPIGGATFLFNVPVQPGQVSYVDGDPAILGKQVWYWVQVLLEIPVGIGTFSTPAQQTETG